MKPSAWTPWIDGLLEAVWVLDPATLRIVAANAAAARLQGVELEDLLDAHAPDLGASLQDPVFWQEVTQDPASHPRHETQLRHGSGTPVLVERLVSPMTLPDGTQVLLVAMRDKSEQQRSQQQLEELLAELRATLESTADGLLVCDLDGKIRAFNRLFAQQWDLPAELQTHDDDAAVYAFLSQAVQNHAQYQQRLAQIQRSPLLEATDVVVLRSGRVLECITRPQLARGRPIGRVYAFRDITERAATEAQLQLAAKVFESSLDAIFVTDPQHRILVCNPMAEQLTQFNEAATPGRLASDLFYSRQHPDWLKELEPKLTETGFWEGELWHRRLDGSSVALQVAWVVLRSAKGKVLNTVVFAKDLTDRIAAQQRIEQLAYSDPLTQLPNRLLLTERVDYAIRMSERSGKGFAVLFLDLDRFKTINDSLGHLFGDMVLLEVARRLKGCLRQTDTLCRLGGDEFVIHLHEADQHAAELTAQRILTALEQPVSIEDISFSLTCSAGIALYPSDGATLNELIQHADTAMYQVKERGKGHYRFYRPQMNTDLLGRIKLDHAMREGLQRNEFVLHYQPRVNLGTDRAQACEALIRWNHPDQGLVFPGAFIGVAEETGLIVGLGDWVLREAVRQRPPGPAKARPARWRSTCRPCNSSKPRLSTKWLRACANTGCRSPTAHRAG